MDPEMLKDLIHKHYTELIATVDAKFPVPKPVIATPPSKKRVGTSTPKRSGSGRGKPGGASKIFSTPTPKPNGSGSGKRTKSSYQYDMSDVDDMAVDSPPAKKPKNNKGFSPALRKFM